MESYSALVPGRRHSDADDDSYQIHDQTQRSDSARVFNKVGNITLVTFMLITTILVTIGVVFAFIEIKDVNRENTISLLMFITATVMFILLGVIPVFKLGVFNNMQLLSIGLAMILNIGGGIYLSLQKRPLKRDTLKGIAVAWGVITIVALLTITSLIGTSPKPSH